MYQLFRSETRVETSELYHNKSRALAHQTFTNLQMALAWVLVLVAHQTFVSQTFRWLWHGFWLSDRRRPGSPDQGKINNWSKFSQNHISQIIREEQQLELQLVPKSKSVAHISDAVIRSKLHIFTFSQGLATSKYYKYPISNIECLMLPKKGFPVEGQIILFKSIGFWEQDRKQPLPSRSSSFSIWPSSMIVNNPCRFGRLCIFFQPYLSEHHSAKLISAPPYSNIKDNLPTLTGFSLTLACHEASRS